MMTSLEISKLSDSIVQRPVSLPELKICQQRQEIEQNWLLNFTRFCSFTSKHFLKDCSCWEAYIEYVGGGRGGFYKFFKQNFVAQETIELNISWPSKFFAKYFMALPINFSFLFIACLWQYFRVVLKVIFKSLTKLTFTMIFKK